MKRSQVGIETVTLIGLLIIIFVIVSIFASDKSTEIKKTTNYLERKNECLRIANLISSVYNSGNGASIGTNTDFLITLYNHSYVGIKDVVNVTESKTNIAVLVSEAGESTQNFYDIVNAKLFPTWYKNCFSDIGASGCQFSGTDVNYNLIPLNLSDLVCNDLSSYTVVYLEDSHIQSTLTCPVTNLTYLQTLKNWVNNSHTLILAEHTMCREQTFGSYSSTSYRCNPAGSNSDAWTMFGHILHQRGGSYGNEVTITAIPDPTFFSGLNQNDQFDFEESSYIERIAGMKKESESFSLSGGFGSSTSCVCSSPSGSYCIRHTGSVSTPANATWISNLTGTYNFKIRYCGENDGNDNWTVYLNNQVVDNWRTSGGEPSWQFRSISDVSLDDNDVIKLSCKRGNSNSYCRSDYAQFISNSEPEFNIVGEYYAGTNPAISYWNYGGGFVFYFGDFQVIQSQQSLYSNIIADLIENTYILYLTPGENEELCFPTAYIKSIGEFSGDIRIKNSNNYIVIENA
ncbi:MAG: hypothetical protein AABW56_05025 [Nanoarchaeota archaeon]